MNVRRVALLLCFIIMSACSRRFGASAEIALDPTAGTDARVYVIPRFDWETAPCDAPSGCRVLTKYPPYRVRGDAKRAVAAVGSNYVVVVCGNRLSSELVNVELGQAASVRIECP